MCLSRKVKCDVKFYDYEETRTHLMNNPLGNQYYNAKLAVYSLHSTLDFRLFENYKHTTLGMSVGRAILFCLTKWRDYHFAR